MLSKIVSSQRGFATTFKKVQVANPVVDMDGDEMTKVIWQWIKDKVSHSRCFANSFYVQHIHPYVDLNIEYYDLSV